MMPQRPAYPAWFGNNPIPAPGVPGPVPYMGPPSLAPTLQYLGQVPPTQLPAPQPIQPARATGLTRARQVAAPQANIPSRTTNANRPTSPLAKSLSRGKPAKKARTY